MNEYSRISLLEIILMDSGCRLLSELSSISRKQRIEIANHISADVPEDAVTLQDYNEAIHYLLCRGPVDTKEKARACLMNGLLCGSVPIFGKTLASKADLDMPADRTGGCPDVGDE